MKNASNRSCCIDAGGLWQSGKCVNGGSSGYSKSDCTACMNVGKVDSSKCGEEAA